MPKLTIVIPVCIEVRTFHRILDRMAETELPGLGGEVISLLNSTGDAHCGPPAGASALR